MNLNFQDEEGKFNFPMVVSVIEMIDNTVVVFFTLEYLARLVLCPNKIRYIFKGSLLRIILIVFWKDSWGKP